MFKIDYKHQLNHTPWNVSLQTRLKLLNDYSKSDFKVFIVLYEIIDNSSFRYRGYNLHESLLSSQEWKCIFFFKDEIQYLYPYLNDIDVITVVRFKWTHNLDQFIRRAKAKRVKIVFDIDDLVFDINYIPMVTNTLNFVFKDEMDYDAWFALVGRVEYTARLADCFTTTNAYLGRILLQKFGKPFSIIPNYLNAAQLSISNACLEFKKSKNSHKPFTIGYFSGTATHINDFKVVYKELVHLLNDFADINLRIVGCLDVPEEMQKYVNSKRIEFVPLVDFIELQRLIAEVDVNIAPLYVNEFTNCKSELKYFEAAAVKTLTCATPTHAFHESITDQINGFLCNEGEWYPKLKQIYLGQIDVNSIVENAYLDVIQKFSGPNIVSQIEHCYSNILKI